MYSSSRLSPIWPHIKPRTENILCRALVNWRGLNPRRISWPVCLFHSFWRAVFSLLLLVWCQSISSSFQLSDWKILRMSSTDIFYYVIARKMKIIEWVTWVMDVPPNNHSTNSHSNCLAQFPVLDQLISYSSISMQTTRGSIQTTRGNYSKQLTHIHLISCRGYHPTGPVYRRCHLTRYPAYGTLICLPWLV